MSDGETGMTGQHSREGDLSEGKGAHADAARAHRRQYDQEPPGFDAPSPVSWEAGHNLVFARKHETALRRAVRANRHFETPQELTAASRSMGARLDRGACASTRRARSEPFRLLSSRGW